MMPWISTALLHPAQAFSHPSDVVNDPDLTLNEKRAILASWASDACAVDSVRLSVARPMAGKSGRVRRRHGCPSRPRRAGVRSTGAVATVASCAGVEYSGVTVDQAKAVTGRPCINRAVIPLPVRGGVTLEAESNG